MNKSKVKRNEHWIAEIQMFPGDNLTRRIIWIYEVDRDGDIGFMLIGDDSVYYRSQVEWFDLVERMELDKNG